MTDERYEEIRRRARAIKLTFGMKGEPLSELITYIDALTAENAELREALEECLHSSVDASTYPDGPCMEKRQ